MSQPPIPPHEFLNEITFKTDFLKNKTWKSIPKFAILVGKNGSGKSQILNEIKSHDSNYNIFYSTPYSVDTNLNSNHIYQKPKYLGQLNIIPTSQIISPNCSPDTFYNSTHQDAAINYLPSTIKNNTHLKESFIKLYNNQHTIDNNQKDSSYYQLFNLFFTYQAFQSEITFEKDEYSIKRDKLDNKDKNELSKNYLFGKINQFIDDNDYHKFFKYNFNLDGTFTPDNSTSTENMNYNKLSSGEKVLLSFIIFAYRIKELKELNFNNKNTILLLDEPDAYLHHSSAKKLIEMLSEISKNSNIQIILTTHNYSTIANAPDESLFAVEEGEITKKDKDTIIYEITDGDLDLTGINSKKYNLFVEGKTDKQIIENAIKKLHKQNTFSDEDFSIIDCGSSNNVRIIIKSIHQMYPNKLLIALYDYDESGIAQYNSIKNEIQDNKFNKSFVKCMHLKVNNATEQKEFEEQKTLSIEYMFKKSLIEKYIQKKKTIKEHIENESFKDSCVCFAYKFPDGKNKTNFANETTNFDKEDFKNFENIFKEIENYIQEFNTNNSNI
jgi:predicted ATP-dependent endonuclease of OLD family